MLIVTSIYFSKLEPVHDAATGKAMERTHRRSQRHSPEPGECLPGNEPAAPDRWGTVKKVRGQLSALSCQNDGQRYFQSFSQLHMSDVTLSAMGCRVDGRACDLPAVVGFVSEHVAEHPGKQLGAYGPGFGPAVSHELLDAPSRASRRRRASLHIARRSRLMPCGPAAACSARG